jgi:hypothetical protein
MESNFQLHFSVSVWCAVLHDHLTGHFNFEGYLTGEEYLQFLQEEFPHLLEDVFLNKQGCMYFQHDTAPPPFKFQISVTIISLGDGSGTAVTTIGQPDLHT